MREQARQHCAGKWGAVAGLLLLSLVLSSCCVVGMLCNPKEPEPRPTPTPSPKAQSK